MDYKFTHLHTKVTPLSYCLFLVTGDSFVKIRPKSLWVGRVLRDKLKNVTSVDGYSVLVAVC